MNLSARIVDGRLVIKTRYDADMLIVLGGFLGSGRSALARRLAEKTGFYQYPLHEKKSRLYLNEKRQLKQRILEPGTDIQRTRVYSEVLNELPLLSKMHTDMIIDDVFHREKPREFFLKEVRAYFSPVVFVWIESPDEAVEPRLRRAKLSGQMPNIAAALVKREKMIKEFEPFSSRPLVFFHRVAQDKRTVDTLLGLINQCVKRGFVN